MYGHQQWRIYKGDWGDKSPAMARRVKQPPILGNPLFIRLKELTTLQGIPPGTYSTQRSATDGHVMFSA